MTIEVYKFSKFLFDRCAILAVPKFPSVLYHYTGPDGFMGIVGSNTLRATHFGFLNDGSEMEHGYKKIIEGFKAEEALLARSPLAGKLLEFGDLLRTEIHQQPSFFFSMCERRDDLSQWRGYGTDGTSYCLGLDVTDILCGSFSPQPILQKIIYNEDEQSQLIAEFVKTSIGFSIEHSSQLLEEDAKKDFLRQIVGFSHHICQRLKNKAFADECEWRMAIPASIPQVEYGFRSSRLGVTPYVVIKPKNPTIKIQLRELIIGPCSNIIAASNAVSAFLSLNGVTNCKISQSAAPLRKT